ncbi:MAG: alanine--tRNA ligase [Planctomycetota bacterium]
MTPDTPPTAARSMTAAQIRRAFIEFFEQKKGHTVVPSSPVVPHDDPTLLFANAGMNQFKPLFQGTVAPGSPLAGLKRAVDTQKCIRAGGKHNDLEDVGRDSYHHTFFEMVGNWSFGDYFKAEAIDWAWELLTGVFGLPADRLYATYFEGDEATGQPADTEARDLWLKHLPAERVLPGNAKDNFWEMGDTGPCGPCSEIHYDRVGGRDAAPLVNQDDPDVLEIWNLVFIQFDRQADASLRPLPNKHVDTGMGLERLVSVLQDKRSNYDTDLFTPYFEAIQKLTGARAYGGKFSEEDDGHIDTAYRVLADHARTLTFALADGAVPGNEGRGYVLRRILRRAVRYARQNLNANEGLVSELVPVVVNTMGDAFPELRSNSARIVEMVADEETSFGKTLDRGIKLFDEVTERAKGGRVSGPDAFQLYDTYGFPIDLTELMAAERGLAVDIDGFHAEMEAQKERSRAGAKGGGPGGLTLETEAIARLNRMNVKPTDDSFKFPGRDIRGVVKAIWNGHNFDEHVRGSTKPMGVILDRTSYYAEMGGQQADHGRLLVSRETRTAQSSNGGEFKVEDVQSFGGFVMHIGRVVRGELRVGDHVTCHIENHRRTAIEANHTATHLLNMGLRAAVSETADQRGSLVAPDRLRFDFANNGPVSPEQLAETEQRVRAAIEADLPVRTDLAPLDTAKGISGLRAVFGETYPDPVRVVSIGAPIEDLLANPGDKKWTELSIEFCGGTHLDSTGQAGAFALVSEEGIAKGIRRITALTGVAAQAAIAAADALDADVAALEKVAPGQLKKAMAEFQSRLDEMTIPTSRRHQIRERLSGLQDKVKAAAKAAAADAAREAARAGEVLADAAERTLDPCFVSTIELGSDRGALQAALKTVAQRVPRTPVMLISPDENAGSAAIMAAAPKDANDKGLKAGDWVRATAQIMGGKGGGRPDAAQGAGPDLSKLKDALAEAKRFALEKLV